MSGKRIGCFLDFDKGVDRGRNGPGLHARKIAYSRRAEVEGLSCWLAWLARGHARCAPCPRYTLRLEPKDCELWASRVIHSVRNDVIAGELSSRHARGRPASPRCGRPAATTATVRSAERSRRHHRIDLDSILRLPCLPEGSAATLISGQETGAYSPPAGLKRHPRSPHIWRDDIRSRTTCRSTAGVEPGDRSTPRCGRGKSIRHPRKPGNAPVRLTPMRRRTPAAVETFDASGHGSPVAHPRRTDRPRHIGIVRTHPRRARVPCARTSVFAVRRDTGGRPHVHRYHIHRNICRGIRPRVRCRIDRERSGWSRERHRRSYRTNVGRNVRRDIRPHPDQRLCPYRANGHRCRRPS